MQDRSTPEAAAPVSPERGEAAGAARPRITCLGRPLPQGRRRAGAAASGAAALAAPASVRASTPKPGERGLRGPSAREAPGAAASLGLRTTPPQVRPLGSSPPTRSGARGGAGRGGSARADWRPRLPGARTCGACRGGARTPAQYPLTCGSALNPRRRPRAAEGRRRLNGGFAGGRGGGAGRRGARSPGAHRSRRRRCLGSCLGRS